LSFYSAFCCYKFITLSGFIGKIAMMILLFKEFCRAFATFELPKDFVLIFVAKIGSFFVFLVIQNLPQNTQIHSLGQYFEQKRVK
jgi:hypothetical protein